MILFRHIPGCVIVFAALLLTLASLIPTQTWAKEVRYVTDELQVTVRSIPSADSKVLFLVKSGMTLTLLESSGEGWAKVRTEDGKEGWMMGRYLRKDKPAVVLLNEANPKSEEADKKLEAMSAENKQLRQELEEAQKQASEATRHYASLKAEAAEYMVLKEEHQKLKEEFEIQGQKLDELGTESDSLRFGNNLKWFLAGAGVLLLGWFLGLAFGKRKRRWSSGLH